MSRSVAETHRSPGSSATVALPCGRFNPRRYVVTPAVLDARQRAGGQEPEQRAGVQRRPVREPQRDGARLGPPDRPALPQLARRPGVHRADRVVELAHAAEARGERDLGQAEVGGLDEHARGLCALRPGQRERPGAQLGAEHAVEVPLGVAEAARQPRHALAVDDAVRDEPHGAPDGVRPHVPLG
nr:hypothetical protein GCM10020092_011720 [Actinoplanes digitatis]